LDVESSEAATMKRLAIAGAVVCIGFSVTGDPNALIASTKLDDVDTFIPAAAGYYDFSDLVPLFGAVGEFNFTVAQIP
jgi:hypothetical protein